MQHNRDNQWLGLAAGAYVFAVVAALGATTASAQDIGNATKPAATRATSTPAKTYFVDFRSRSALSYGHTFLVYGRVNARGKIIESHVAGLSPFTESSIPWMVGHLVPVPSETGATDGDTEDQYITASYRVLLNEAEYRKAVAYIKQHQVDSPMWHALMHNCNAWVGEVAAYMGLKTPYSSVLLFPADYITNLRELNGGRRYLDASFAGGADAMAKVAAAPARNAGATARASSASPAAGAPASVARGASPRARSADATPPSEKGADTTGTVHASPAQSIY